MSTPSRRSPSGHRRDRSDSSLASMQAEVNKNVNWFNSAWSHLAYLVGILLFRAACFAVVPKSLGTSSNALEWTITNIAHGVVAFISLHWVRGSPIWEDQGEFIGQTAWEQIDNGVPWTATRKFLIIVPVALFGLSWALSTYDSTYLIINLIVVLIQVVAKLPELHGVRLWGFNEARLD